MRRRVARRVWSAPATISVPRELEHAAAVLQAACSGTVGGWMESTVIVDERERLQSEACEPVEHRLGRKNAMRVEANALPSDRHRKIKTTSGGKHACELARCLSASFRIDRVAIAPEPDVLDDVQARERRNARVVERQCQDVSGHAPQPGQFSLQWPIVD